MDDNFKNDYSLLEQDTNVFDSKIKKQKKVSVFFLFIVGIIIVICFAYRGDIKNIISSSNTITITSKDGTQKMSLMNKDIKYRGPDSCPKGYHIPTAYEWRKVGKLWCENHEICDANGYIGFEGTFLWYAGARESYNEIKNFFSDVSIHLDKHFDFGAGFTKEKELGIRNKNSYCNALDADDYLNGHASFSVDYYDLVDCDEPKYVRCFSDENLTAEFINEENFKYGIERTKFEIDGISYSGRKIIGMPRGDVVIPDSFVGIPIIEVGGGLYGNITSVKLGENIIKIDDHAFASNGIGIKEIEIPDSVLYIGDYAFLNNQLTSVKFSNNLLYVGEHAFDNNKLTSIKLPNTVKFIGTGAFGGNEISSFHIPNGIKEISPEILRNNNLETIIIPEGVEVIGDLAFYANDLTEVSLPQSLKTIGKQAFSCNNLTNIILPKSVELIGKVAFCGNRGGRDTNLKGSYCGENGYVVIKGYPKNSEACININPFKSCRSKEENLVCGKYGRIYRNLCSLKVQGDEESLNYEIVDKKCVLKKD